MKVKVIVVAVIDTEDLTNNKEVKTAIERAAFNKASDASDNLAKLWAVDEVARRGYDIAITLELL